MYDVIGDIHGHADALERLLGAMGYAEQGGTWRHPERTVIFVGDFIDRGSEIARVLEIARGMVDAGTAQAVMGNHEFNAVAFHMPHPIENQAFLRERSYKNIRQFEMTLQQLSEAQLEESIDWFLEFPMWLELDGLRVVHACWDPVSMAVVDRGRARHGRLNNAFVHEACESDNELFEAVEVLLKGKEVRLPEGVAFHDKDGETRHHVRTQWYRQPQDLSFRDYAFAFSFDTRERIPEAPIPPDTIAEACPYPPDAPPVLFGHYWMPPDNGPSRLAPNVACLDYSVAKGGRLCAYRWSGERELDDANFVSVPAEA